MSSAKQKESQPLNGTSVWVVTEGMVGTENQCVGIAEHMGVGADFVVKRCGLRWPWSILSPYIGFEQSWSFTGDALCPPWPDILIASGRKSIAVSRYIKKKSGGRTFTVQVQDPRISPTNFDLVSVPAHDPSRGDNVVVTYGAPNRMTMEKLARAEERFREQFALLPVPKVAVLIGGNSKSHIMSHEMCHKLASDVLGLAEKGFGVMVTASRRTGPENMQALQGAFEGHHNIFFWNGEGDNPYLGMLASADYILVTADSVSMISDAGTTGKPVYIIPMDENPRFGAGRLTSFHNHLIDHGVARYFSGDLEHYTYPPLADAKHVADEIIRRYNEHYTSKE